MMQTKPRKSNTVIDTIDLSDLGWIDGDSNKIVDTTYNYVNQDNITLLNTNRYQTLLVEINFASSNSDNHINIISAVILEIYGLLMCSITSIFIQSSDIQIHKVTSNKLWICNHDVLSSQIMNPIIVTWIFISMFTISIPIKRQLFNLVIILIQTESHEIMHNLNELLRNIEYVLNVFDNIDTRTDMSRIDGGNYYISCDNFLVQHTYLLQELEKKILSIVYINCSKLLLMVLWELIKIIVGIHKCLNLCLNNCMYGVESPYILSQSVGIVMHATISKTYDIANAQSRTFEAQKRDANNNYNELYISDGVRILNRFNIHSKISIYVFDNIGLFYLRF